MTFITLWCGRAIVPTMKLFRKIDQVAWKRTETITYSCRMVQYPVWRPLSLFRLHQEVVPSIHSKLSENRTKYYSVSIRYSMHHIKIIREKNQHCFEKMFDFAHCSHQLPFTKIWKRKKSALYATRTCVQLLHTWLEIRISSCRGVRCICNR